MSVTSFNYWKDVVSHGRETLHLKISQVSEEVAALIDQATKSGPINSTLEIGSQDGGTLWIAIQMLELDGHAFTVDLPNGPFGGVDSQSLSNTWRSWTRATQTLDTVFGDSHSDGTKLQLVEALRSRSVEKVDFLFIDGDHTYDGVKRDFEMYKDLVRSGGVIAFHDVCHHPNHNDVRVDQFWHEIKAQYPVDHVFEFINSKDQGWAGIGCLVVPKT